MDWDAIGAIGEIVGALAVVVTLGYLAIQTRYARQATENNTKAIHSAARIESGRYWSEEGIQLAVNPDMAKLVSQGFKDAKTLDDADRERYVAWIAQHMIAADVLYLQYKDGSLPAESWAPHETLLSGMLRYDSIKRVLDAGVIPTSHSFGVYLNELRTKNDVGDWTFHENARIFD